MAGGALKEALTQAGPRTVRSDGGDSRHASQQLTLRLAEGGLGVVVGMLVLSAWSTSVSHVAVILGTGQLVLGLGQFVTAAACAPGQRGRRLLMASSVISILFGALVLNVITSTEGRLRVAMGIWFVLVALADLALSRRDSPRRWHRWAAGATAAVAVALFIGTSISLAALTGIVGGSLLVRGVYEVLLGLRLRAEQQDASGQVGRLDHLVPREVIPSSGYSQVVVGQGALVMVSGQVALDPMGKLIGAGSAEVQAGQALTNLARCLAAAGCDWSDVAKLTCYVTGTAAMDPILRALHDRLDGAPPPACTMVVVNALVLSELLLEVEALAIINEETFAARLQSGACEAAPASRSRGRRQPLPRDHELPASGRCGSRDASRSSG